MKPLVIFPTTMHSFSFSAPAAWLFSHHKDKIRGLYGFELTHKHIIEHDFFIIELNWFIQLKEFRCIVKYIKNNNKNAKILFGGLYSSLKYDEIFKRCDVDYFIKGDNELPIKMLLDGENIKHIPNIISRNFRSKDTYIFTESEFMDLEIDLSWFPSYFKYLKMGVQYYKDEFSLYNHLYPLPILFTTKGGCSVPHTGCEYCLGSKHDILKDIYSRPPVVMTNNSLMHLLRKIEKKFERASLYIMSDDIYDFSNKHFNLDINIEIDAPMSAKRVSQIIKAFDKCIIHVSIYEDGLKGNKINPDYMSLLDLEDENHQILFFTYKADLKKVNIPQKNILYSEDLFPEWAFFDYYNDFSKARFFSDIFYKKLDKSWKFCLE